MRKGMGRAGVCVDIPLYQIIDWGKKGEVAASPLLDC
jgi:hypothetical protein